MDTNFILDKNGYSVKMTADISVAFTGHRPIKIDDGYNDNSPAVQYIKAQLRDSIIAQILKGHKIFISGMAIGVDSYAAGIVIELRKSFPEIKLVCAVPFKGQESMWPEESKKRYEYIISQADHVEIICAGTYSPFKMQQRNQWMVNRCSVLIAVWDGTPGGTGNCVRYAKGLGTEIIQIIPKQNAELSAPTFEHLPDEVLREGIDEDGNKYQVVATDISVMKTPTGPHRPLFSVHTQKGPIPPKHMTMEEFRKA